MSTSLPNMSANWNSIVGLHQSNQRTRRRYSRAELLEQAGRGSVAQRELDGPTQKLARQLVGEKLLVLTKPGKFIYYHLPTLPPDAN